MRNQESSDFSEFFSTFQKILIEKPNHFFQDTPIPKTFKVKMSEEMTKITIWNTMIITEEYFDCWLICWKLSVNAVFAQVHEFSLLTLHRLFRRYNISLSLTLFVVVAPHKNFDFSTRRSSSEKKLEVYSKAYSSQHFSFLHEKLALRN